MLRAILGIGVIVIAGSASVAEAQNVTAAQVLDRYVVVTGGKAGYERLRTFTMEGRITVKGQGIGGTMKAQMKAPNKFYVVQNIQGIGEARQGFDGKVGWSKDPFMGLRKLQGAELELTRVLSDMQGPVKWRQLFKRAELVGVRNVEGKRTHAVKMIPHRAKPITGYYDTSTGLMLRMDVTMESPQGVMPMQVVAQDYRMVGGIKIPYLMVQRMGTVMEMSIRITSAKAGVPVSDSMFVMPAR